jgi:hypothetical protein
MFPFHIRGMRMVSTNNRLLKKSAVFSDMTPCSPGEVRQGLRYAKPATNEYKTKLNSVAFGPRANYADRATAASWRSSANFCG